MLWLTEDAEEEQVEQEDPEQPVVNPRRDEDHPPAAR